MKGQIAVYSGSIPISLVCRNAANAVVPEIDLSVVALMSDGVEPIDFQTSLRPRGFWRLVDDRVGQL